jgi:hypothetical protein
VVQAETKDLISRFGLFTSPTDYIVEGAGVDICPFADMFVFFFAGYRADGKMNGTDSCQSQHCR